MSRKRILLVDDAKTILMMEKMLIGSSRFTIVTACNGAEALATARAEQPDLILMDIVMPVMNGLDALKAMRATESLKSTPIIMVSTRSELESLEAAFINGCTDFVTKPIDGVELMAKIHNFLGE